MGTAPETAKMILFAYATPDLDETAAWYSDALGIEFPGDAFQVDRLDVEKGKMSDGDAKIELLQMAQWRGVEPGFGSGHIGFQVKDIKAVRQHLISMGSEPSEIIFPFEGNTGVKICYFRGPNSEKLELVQIDQ